MCFKDFHLILQRLVREQFLGTVGIVEYELRNLWIMAKLNLAIAHSIKSSDLSSFCRQSLTCSPGLEKGPESYSSNAAIGGRDSWHHIICLLTYLIEHTIAVGIRYGIIFSIFISCTCKEGRYPFIHCQIKKNCAYSIMLC